MKPALMRFIFILIGSLLASAGAAAAQAPKAPANDDCLACHGDQSATRANGSSVAVSADIFGKSIHTGLACVDCHADLAKTTEWPHAEKLQPVSCATCHADAVKVALTSVHYTEKSGKGARCVDCHGTHDIRPASDPASRTYGLNLPKTCAQCHSGGTHMEGPKGLVSGNYEDSVHGRGVAKSGLLVSANCTSCHGAHDIKTKTDPESRVHRTKIAATCTKCHEGIAPVYAKSVHAQQQRYGNTAAAVCSDCHTSHKIQRTGTDAWQLAAIEECGTCHLNKIATYRDTFHGQVTALGFTRVATCSDCHGHHDILPLSNAASAISSVNRVATCRKCHAQASENFAKYDPHADKNDRYGSPALYWSTKGMQALLGGVFLFFGIHTLLWFPRSYLARRQRRADLKARAS
ncbi:MAG: cytochrome c3 family protein [Vicinamibacterales bacterium]